MNKYLWILGGFVALVVLLAVPCAVGLLTFATPLVATLFHHGALQASDVGQIAVALAGYGVGLLGLVAIKVLAPGYYASQDIRTPVRIAIVVLVFTQLMNAALVPLLAHAGLALSIGLGAIINALWLLSGLLRRGSFQVLGRAGGAWGCRWWRRVRCWRCFWPGARCISTGWRCALTAWSVQACWRCCWASRSCFILVRCGPAG
jgi:peptidoglycan biosynthesis protein MviN/MurJ (putative lipid II flippase)